MLGALDHKPPNILFFQNVYPTKYDFDAMMTKDIMDELNRDMYSDDLAWAPESATITPVRSFDVVPEKFVSVETWPKETNLACWQCKRSFKTRPMAIVTNATNIGLKIAIDMDVWGNLCSADCAGTLLDSREQNKEVRWRMEKLTCILYRRLTGRVLTELPRAPSYWELEQFGGRLSIDDFTKGLEGVIA